MSGNQAASRYSSEYADIAHQLPGQKLEWLTSFREQAAAHFDGKGFPGIREEEWRYTNVSGIEKKLFRPHLQAQSEVDSSLLQQHTLADCYTVVLHNGRFSSALSNLSGLPTGVTVCGIGEALQNHSETVRRHLGQAVSDREHNFVAFNNAWFSDGLYLHVSAKKQLDKPLQILHVVDQPDLLATTRNLLIIDAQAEVRVIETYAGDDQAYLNASVTEVFIAENAALKQYKVQVEAEKAYHFGGCYVKQARDSRFVHHNFAFGGLLARNDVHVDLDIASECELNGFYLGVKRQHIDNHTRVNHLQPHGISREQYKGVLDDRARGVFQGRVIVAEHAQKTDSEMNNRNLLLSDNAEADTKPQLEIYADDVKCAHGVTVGQLDEKSIFYLQSRCVDEETARNMLTFAFANEMVNKVEIQSLHDFILEQLLQRFPQQGVEMSWL